MSMSRLLMNQDADPKQVVLIRRNLMAAGTSLLVVCLLAVGYAQGMLAAPVLIEATAIIAVLVALMYAVFRAGLNRRFPDPSLTMEQIVVASMTMVYIMYQAEQLRGILLLVYLMPLLFGVLGLNRTRLLLLVLLLLVAYAGMVLLSAYTKPGDMDPATEVTRFAVLCIVLPWFATMGGYYHSLRERLRHAARELRQALEQQQQTNQALRDSHAELARLASTDRLTGAWNRRRLEEAVGDEMDRLERYAHPLSVLVIDIDLFKNVNDLHGHAAGDRLLVALAEQIRSSLRAADSLTRWGGEEFVVLCPNTALPAAAVFAERLRATIAAADFPEAPEVTVSIGVAECLRGEEWEQWFQRADAALYRAKVSGRNRVEIAPGTPGLPDEASAVSGNLMQLVWHSAYECGHEVVDREHRALFRRSNELLAAVLTGRPAEEVADVAGVLVADLEQHFRDEESIVAEAGYAGAAAHAGIHRELLHSARALIGRFRSGTADLGEFFRFLAEDVVVKHILGADRDFFPSLAQRHDRGQVLP